MQIHFYPPSLAVALHAPALYQLIIGSRPTGMYGRCYVEKEDEESQVNLSFQPAHGTPVTVSFEERLLWSGSSHAELSEHVAELFRKCDPDARLIDFPGSFRQQTAEPGARFLAS